MSLHASPSGFLTPSRPPATREEMIAAYKERRRREAMIPVVREYPTLTVDQAEGFVIMLLVLANLAERQSRRSAHAAVCARDNAEVSGWKSRDRNKAIEKKPKPYEPKYEPKFIPSYANRIKHIQRRVCDEFEVSFLELVSHRRTAHVVLPRQAAMYLIHRLTTRSLPDIGRAFERDHTTVFHAVRKIAALVAKPGETTNKIEKLAARIAEDFSPYGGSP